MRGVSELEPSLRVDQQVAERLIFHQPWWKPWTSRKAVADFIASANAVIDDLARDLVDEQSLLTPIDGHAFVNDLSPIAQFVLASALALIGRPTVLLIDDIDSLRESSDRRLAWRALGAFLDRCNTITAFVSCESTSDCPPHLIARATRVAMPSQQIKESDVLPPAS